MMHDTNEGLGSFEKMLGVVKTLLGTAGRDTLVLDDWHKCRWCEVQVELGRYFGTREVNAFISDYANTLAESLAELIVSNSWEVLEEIPMDYGEELLLQTRSFAAATPEAPICDIDDDITEVLFEECSVQEYTWAA